METKNFHIVGIAPLIMHNVRLADPLDEFAKKVKKLTANRRKTEEIHEQIAREEFEGGLYFDKALGPYIPADNIERMIVDAAKASKLGATVKESMLSVGDRFQLAYEGPRTVQELYDEKFLYRRAVGMRGSKTVRTRPMFPNWAVEFTLSYDPERLNGDQVRDIIEYGGRYKGLCDFRPRFGRFKLNGAK
jgi:hypothetical protein